VEVEVLPSITGPFRHPDLEKGETMQVVSMGLDDGSMTADIGLGGPGSWPPRAGVTYPSL
jgi:hypothetical protein